MTTLKFARSTNDLPALASIPPTKNNVESREIILKRNLTIKNAPSTTSLTANQPPSWKMTRENSSTCTCFQEHNCDSRAPRRESRKLTATFTVTSPASAAQPTESSKRRTTHPCKSQLAKSMRTADSLERAKSTHFAALYERWARATIR